MLLITKQHSIYPLKTQPVGFKRELRFYQFFDEFTSSLFSQHSHDHLATWCLELCAKLRSTTLHDHKIQVGHYKQARSSVRLLQAQLRRIFQVRKCNVIHNLRFCYNAFT